MLHDLGLACLCPNQELDSGAVSVWSLCVQRTDWSRLDEMKLGTGAGFI